jgi:hypothetical protein
MCMLTNCTFRRGDKQEDTDTDDQTDTTKKPTVIVEEDDGYTD